MYDKFGRPDKELYFMNLAFNISLRSIDPHTKHGCVVTRDGAILTTGYNGPVRNIADDQVDLNRKTKSLIHAEENAILQAARNGINLNKSEFYITGMPCVECLARIIQVGGERVIFGPREWSKSKDAEYLAKYPLLLNRPNFHMQRCFCEHELIELMESNLKNIKDLYGPTT
jgi:dCMP deaminase